MGVLNSLVSRCISADDVDEAERDSEKAHPSLATSKGASSSEESDDPQIQIVSSFEEDPDSAGEDQHENAEEGEKTEDIYELTILPLTNHYTHLATPFPNLSSPYLPLLACLTNSSYSTIPSFSLINFDTETIVSSYCLPRIDVDRDLFFPRRLDDSYPEPFRFLFQDVQRNTLVYDLLCSPTPPSTPSRMMSFMKSNRISFGLDEYAATEDLTCSNGSLWRWFEVSGYVFTERLSLDPNPNPNENELLRIYSLEEEGDGEERVRYRSLYHLSPSTVLRLASSVVNIWNIDRECRTETITEQVEGSEDSGFQKMFVSERGRVTGNLPVLFLVGNRSKNWCLSFGNGASYCINVVESNGDHEVCDVTFTSEYSMIVTIGDCDEFRD